VDQQILDVTVHNLSATVILPPGFVHPCCSKYLVLVRDLSLGCGPIHSGSPTFLR